MSSASALRSGSCVLITGADGMLGRAFIESLTTLEYDVRVLALDHDACDVTNRDEVLGFASERPDFILHCAGLALADECERDPQRAREIHVAGTAHVAELARCSKARVFYPQSVFIFDGSELPVDEQTAPAPVFVYGKVKLEAERLLLETTRDALVVRMAGFFGGEERDKNFVGQFLASVRRLREDGGGEVAVGDRMWQPTYTLDHASNVLLLLAHASSGIYHMGARGEATFFDVAEACVDELGLAGEIALRRSSAQRFAASEPARRPARMVTANHRLEREGLCRQRPWHEALRDYLRRPYFNDLRG